MQYDLPQIKKRGKITVLTLNSSLSYFRYRGEEMGFQYELAKEFAKSLGVKLDIKVAKSNDEMFKMLKSGKGDIIAYNFPVTKEYKDSINFCGEEVISHQVLVQRKDNENEVKNVTELIGKEIYVKPGKHYDRLVNLDKELGGGI
ncbi:transporter substrate-binding domain-containing protein, partial [Phocaeicola paurosaccharolyticus]